MKQVDNSLGIYIHVPFCVKKCDYCDFLSGPAGAEEQRRYMEALREEIRMVAGAGAKRSESVSEDTIDNNLPDQLAAGEKRSESAMGDTSFYHQDTMLEDNEKSAACNQSAKTIDGTEPNSEMNRAPLVDTIFFGGGTPSILPAEEIAKTLEVIRACFDVAEDAEITVECNPGTLTEEKCLSYRACGVNRLSIGLQSADNRLLKNIGRIHSFEEFLESYNAARRAGFQNINIDLMSGLPGQSVQDHVDTLHRVLALRPEHISAYSLILEEGTPLYERVLGGSKDENGRVSHSLEGEVTGKNAEFLQSAGGEEKNAEFLQSIEGEKRNVEFQQSTEREEGNTEFLQSIEGEKRNVEFSRSTGKIENETKFSQSAREMEESKGLLCPVREMASDADRLPSEDEEMEMYVKTREILEAHGYHRYEISNYSLPGRECRHNLRYWNLSDYYGFGIGAASFADGCRFKNTEDREKYVRLLQPEPGRGHLSGKCGEQMGSHGVKNSTREPRLRSENREEQLRSSHEELRMEFVHETDRELMEEFVFLGLRKIEGIRMDEFAGRFGQEFDTVYGSVRKKLMDQGFLKENPDGTRLCLTDRGIDFSNEVLAEFLQ